MSIEQNDRDFIHGGAGGHVGGASGHVSTAAGGFGGGAPTIDFHLAQQRIDNLRGIALRQAVDAHGGKIAFDGNALDANLIVQSARQFYAFLSGDTPTEG